MNEIGNHTCNCAVAVGYDAGNCERVLLILFDHE